MSLIHLWVPSSARPADTHCHSFQPHRQTKKEPAASPRDRPTPISTLVFQADILASALRPPAHSGSGGTKGRWSEFAIKAQRWSAGSQQSGADAGRLSGHVLMSGSRPKEVIDGTANARKASKEAHTCKKKTQEKHQEGPVSDNTRMIPHPGASAESPAG